MAKMKRLTSIYAKYGIDFSCMRYVESSSDGCFSVSNGTADFIAVPQDRKVEFIGLRGKLIAYVKSELGFPCFYPVDPVCVPRHIHAVMMDLDGTTVKSESFWIKIIEMTTARLLEKTDFSLSSEDLPFVSGHSVSEHLQYCIDKYCPEKTLAEASEHYFDITHYEMDEIMNGRGMANAFEPNAGVKEFLLYLKKSGIKIGLVTSGLYEKAYPEILGAFKTMGFKESPESFYDSFITAGYRLKKGAAGTLGELEPKPHPWLYAETYNVGLGVLYKNRNEVIGIEDSSAGVYSVRLSNVYTIGINGGNIIQSGTRSLCNGFYNSFDEIRKFIEQVNG